MAFPTSTITPPATSAGSQYESDHFYSISQDVSYSGYASATTTIPSTASSTTMPAYVTNDFTDIQTGDYQSSTTVSSVISMLTNSITDRFNDTTESGEDADVTSGYQDSGNMTSEGVVWLVSTAVSSTTDDEGSKSDEGVGAILQVLLHGAIPEGTVDADLTTAAHLAVAASGTAVTDGGLGDVTSDMQYAIVTNVTNITIDLLTNATYHGVLTIGGGIGGLGGDQSAGPLHHSRYSLHEGILIGLILSLIVFFSVAGNVVVCVAIVSDRNLRKSSNYFIISLAVADMLVASMVMSFAVANDILGYWVFGETFCSVWISLDIMCSTASIVNLCCISLDRYVHIRSPLHYETWVTPARTLVAVSVVWILSALISFLPIHLGWHQLGLTPEATPVPPSPSPSPAALLASSTTFTAAASSKEPYICMMELNPWYAVVSSMFSFYMPCVVMIAIYLKLYAYARRHVDAIRTQTRTPMLQNGASPGKGKTTYYKVADHKAAITLGVIMGTFLFCWTPFFTINIVGAFCPVCIPTVVFQVFSWLGYFNSALNPIIYSIFNKEFRDAFKRVLNFRRCCRRYDQDFRRPIKYTETYGTVKKMTANEVTAV